MDVSLSVQRRMSALAAGTALVVMALAAFFAYGYVHENIVVQGDAGVTYANVVSSISLFKAEIFGWVIIVIADIVAAWALYVFLAPVHKNLSLLGAWLRLIYTAVLGIAVSSLIFVLLLSRHASDLPTEHAQPLTMLIFDAFELIWSVGLVIFGGHLLIVGYLVLKADYVPKVIGILLLLASIGYIVVHLGKAFFSQYEGVISTLNLIFTVPMVAGELGLGVWLLFKHRRLY